MAVQVTLKSNSPRAVSVPSKVAKTIKSVGASKQALYQSINTSNTHLSYTNVQDIIEELANRFYQRSTTPTKGLNEGDLWYDTAENQLKLYNGVTWDRVATRYTNATDDYFLFSTLSSISTGNVAEFKNNTDTVFSIQYDGVPILKEQSTPPTAVDNGIYSDGGNLYYGKKDQ